MSHSNGGAAPFSIIAEHAVPDFYTDSVSFEISVYGITLEFGKTRKPPEGFTGPPPTTPVVRLHMSPQHAKVMAKVFAKNMKAYEDTFGTIAIPPELFSQLGITEGWE